MAARMDEPTPSAAKQHESETSSDVPLSASSSSSSSSSSSGPPPPPPPEPAEESPRRPISRKRAASINTEEANRPKVEVLDLSTPSTASPRPFDASGGRICLCTPAPKIPRPRNAFILYRQHHQARVVQQNPRLANPEISKIIGEQWRAESEEAKSQWKLLAEEEKQRHQRQHPDYRYQPRRGNKVGSLHPSRPTSTPGEDPHHCPKCGGRYIATPKTPSTPFMTPTVFKIGSTPYGSPPGDHDLGSKGDMSRQNRSHPAAQWGAAISNPYPSNAYDVHERYEAAMSPNDVKRRRYNTTGSYHNFHALPSPPTPFTQPGHHPQYHLATFHSYSRRPSLSNPPTAAATTHPSDSLSGPSAIMPPPPRPSHGVPVPGPVPTSASAAPYKSSSSSSSSNQHRHHHYSHHRRHHPEFDESLRLPPLQTHLPASPDESSEPVIAAAAAAAATVAAGTETGLGILHPTPTIPSYGAKTAGRGEGGVKIERDVAAERAHARSVEAMVMSISFVSKLRVLERISPPLGVVPGAPGSGMSRGPVIAVEGPDARMVQAVSRVVERALRAASPAAEEKGGGWEVRCWEDENASVQRRGSVSGGQEKDEALNNAGQQSASRHGSQASAISSPSANLNPFTAYLRTIADWHAKSAEIVQFVTPSAPAPASTATRQTRLLSTSSAATAASSSSFAEGPTESDRTEPEGEDESAVRSSHCRAPASGSADAAGASRTTTSAINKNVSRLPIALLPSGFSLTLSDRFASALPISDAYAPVDHWQWMATLWRGIVGPDLVIYVLGTSTLSPGSVAGKDATPALGGGGVGPWNGSVEVKNESLIVVKIPTAAAAAAAASGGGSGSRGSGLGFAEADRMMIDEKMERRLGFEVVEWIQEVDLC
ncbi:hypothetical protein L209DRAFT_744144 [Thermothelomyces heterothallicus CBS 203.75]